MKRRHLAGHKLNYRLMYFVIAREFCRIFLFSGRRTCDKTGEDYRNLAATKGNTEMTRNSHHYEGAPHYSFLLSIFSKCVPNLL